MPPATAVRAPQRFSSAPAALRCRIRLADGRTFTGELAPERHRSLQVGLLHDETEGLVEVAAGVRRDGRLQITTRRRADHFLPGGGSRGHEWRQALLELAARHADRGEEVFVAPAARYTRRGDKHAVCASRWLWVDVDQPGQLHALWAFLAERPCHLLVESGVIRSGGRGDRCASGDDRWRHVADGRIGLTRVGRGRHTTCTTCRPPLGAPSCRCVRKKGWRP